MEELSALKEVEEAAIAEAEAAAAEAANAAAGLFDFEDEDESETASPSKKSPEKGTGVRIINIQPIMSIVHYVHDNLHKGVVLDPGKLGVVTSQLQVNQHNNSQLVNGSNQSLRYKVIPDTGVMDGVNNESWQDVLVLNEIIDRISERPSSMLDDEEDDVGSVLICYSLQSYSEH